MVEILKVIKKLGFKFSGTYGRFGKGKENFAININIKGDYTYVEISFYNETTSIEQLENLLNFGE